MMRDLQNRPMWNDGVKSVKCCMIGSTSGCIILSHVRSMFFCSTMEAKFFRLPEYEVVTIGLSRTTNVKM